MLKGGGGFFGQELKKGEGGNREGHFLKNIERMGLGLDLFAPL